MFFSDKFKLMSDSELKKQVGQPANIKLKAISFVFFL